MSEEIPKWLSKKMNNYVDSCDNMSGSFLTRHLIEIRKKAFLECFEFLSKPENAAKISEVAKLINACKIETFDYVDMGTGDSWKKKGFNHDKIIEALAPFQGGE